MSQMKKGQEGIVAGLETNNLKILKKLVAMGIMPGVPMKLIQTFPSYVFQAGFSQVAVDKEVASVILVDVEN